MKVNILYKTKGLLMAVLLGFTVSSCQDFLEVTPKSSFDEQFVFNNVVNARSTVLGIYAAMAGEQGYGIRLSMYYPYDNDLILGASGAVGDGERRDLARYNLEPSNRELDDPFYLLYSGIERANIAIANIPNMQLYNNGSEADKKELRRLHGEALTLRAQFYFELIRNWGDVPAPFEPAATQPDLFMPKNNRDLTYDRILEDLKTAATLVPWRTEAGTNNERITKGAVKGLRARIALFRGGYALRRENSEIVRRGDYLKYYEIARQEAKEIMDRPEQHTLNPSFQSIFKDFLLAHRVDNTFGEIMFEVAMSGGSGASDSRLGYYNGPRLNGRGNSSLRIVPTFFYAFNRDDNRRDVTVAPYNLTRDYNKIVQPLSNLFDGKFRRDWITNPSFGPDEATLTFGVNWPILRFSDVVLMFAEAENEINGPTAAAYNAVNQIRRRGFGKPINTPNATVDLPAGLSKAAFFNAIVDERAFELAGEGIRKYDLIRWDLFQTKIEETRSNLRKMIAKQAPYERLPQHVYYKTNSQVVEWLGGVNALYTPTTVNTAPAGFARINWVASLNEGYVVSVAQFFQRKKKELYPFHQTFIDAHPKLGGQDYGY